MWGFFVCFFLSTFLCACVCIFYFQAFEIDNISIVLKPLLQKLSKLIQPVTEKPNGPW